MTNFHAGLIQTNGIAFSLPFKFPPMNERIFYSQRYSMIPMSNEEKYKCHHKGEVGNYE